MESIGYRVTTVLEDVTARQPQPEEARLLQMKPGTPRYSPLLAPCSQAHDP
ncbi:MAG: hypothetical protein ACRDZO_16930 [Egibacteraceae bacterium]